MPIDVAGKQLLSVWGKETLFVAEKGFLPPDPYSSEKAVLGERGFFTMYS